jgi:hypothetical protein
MFVRELAGQAWYMQVPVRGRVSLAQVALLLNVTVMTVHRWVSAGDLRAVDSPESKRKYVKLSDVRNFAADRGLFLGVAK